MDRCRLWRVNSAMKTVENYFTNIESYHRIVTSHYHDYLEMIKDYDNYSNGKDFSDLDEETQNIIYAVQKSMDEAAMVIIAFSQMTIESFCNAYLIKTYSKKVLSSWSFEKRINTTISSLLLTAGVCVSKKDLPNFYGDGISELMKKRNKIVHRYPVIVEFPISDKLDSKAIKRFVKASKVGAEKIEKQALRRIDRSVVQQISLAYPTFIKKLADAGCKLENLPFRYKV